jgi:Zn-dependent alcohol dehydrogenase
MGGQACYVPVIIPPAEHTVVVRLLVRRKELLGSCTGSIILNNRIPEMLKQGEEPKLELI